MSRRTFTKMVARLAKADGLTAAPRKAAVLHSLKLWDEASVAERTMLTEMLDKRLAGQKYVPPPQPKKEDNDGDTVR